MELTEITVSICHDSLKVTFTIPEELIITDKRVLDELTKDCYKHSLARFNPDNDDELSVMLDTVAQFSTFVSWLAETIKEEW